MTRQAVKALEAVHSTDQSVRPQGPQSGGQVRPRSLPGDAPKSLTRSLMFARARLPALQPPQCSRTHTHIHTGPSMQPFAGKRE